MKELAPTVADGHGRDDAQGRTRCVKQLSVELSAGGRHREYMFNSELLVAYLLRKHDKETRGAWCILEEPFAVASTVVRPHCHLRALSM